MQTTIIHMIKGVVIDAYYMRPHSVQFGMHQ